jgi:hypothetical protein
MYESVDQLTAPDIWGNKKKRSSAMDIVIREAAAQKHTTIYFCLNLRQMYQKINFSQSFPAFYSAGTFSNTGRRSLWAELPEVIESGILRYQYQYQYQLFYMFRQKSIPTKTIIYMFFLENRLS